MEYSQDFRTWKERLIDQTEAVYADAESYRESLPAAVTDHLCVLAADAAKYQVATMEAPVAVIAARKAIDFYILGAHCYSEIRGNDDPELIALDDLTDVVATQPRLMREDLAQGLSACIRRKYLEILDDDGVSRVRVVY